MLLPPNLVSDLRRAVKDGRAVSTFGGLVMTDQVFANTGDLLGMIDEAPSGADTTALSRYMTYSVVIPTEPFIRTETCVGHWHMDASSSTPPVTLDETSNDNDLLLGNCTLASGGKWSNCLSLNGTTAVASVTISSTEPIGKFLFVGFWIKPTTLIGTSPLVYLDDAFLLYAEDTGLKLSVTDGVTPEIIVPSLTLTAGVWQYVSFQFNAGTIFISVGDLVYKTTSTLTTFAAHGTALQVGNNLGDYYDGLLDELLIDANVRIEDDWPVVTDFAGANDVIFWSCNENSGTTMSPAGFLGITATKHGGTWVAGYRDYAIQFNGTTDYADATPVAETFSDDALSIEIGVRFDVDAACQIISQISGLNLEYTGTHIRANINGVSAGATDIAPLTVDTNTWYNIAVVYNGSKKQCWVNGQKYGEIDATGTASMTANTLYLARNVAGDSFGACSIDFVRIYRAIRKPYYRDIPLFCIGQHGLGVKEEWMVP